MKTLTLLTAALGLALWAAPVSAVPAPAADGGDAAGLDFFEKKIRPVLADKCFKCHSASAEKIKGGLTLDTREATRRGGDNGAAVVPGNVNDSLLIEAVRYGNKDFAMPPTKAGGKLPDAVIADFETWVTMGAPDPRHESPGAPGSAAPAKSDAWEKSRDWWAWQNPQIAPAPAVKNTAWPKGQIDRFLLAAMEAKGVQPVGDADPATLLRRVYFDLIGLPPSPQEISSFLADKSPEALATVVDRLLARPQFGERWGRHWLDVARYAESSGKDANIAFPNAWRYRDYVIAAFNEDKPFDRFLREQVAGDLLPAKSPAERAEQMVATGFLAIGPKSLNEQNKRQYALDLADEQIDVTSQAFLGLTVACARCHDHKFDPIPQKEYYSLAGIFLSTDTRYGTAGGPQDRHPTDLLELPAEAHPAVLSKTLPPAERARKEQRVADLKKELLENVRAGGEQPAAGTAAATPAPKQAPFRNVVALAQIGFLQNELKSYNADGTMKPLAMGACDLPATSPGGGASLFGGGRFGQGMAAEGFGARLRERYGRGPEFSSIGDSAVYARGDADKPGEKVPRGFLTLLTHSTPPSIPQGTSGRLQLAEWMTDSSNPLTARVIVNRVWHWIFGEGLVPSTDNFGTSGHLPTNQALLDTLAVQLENRGWSIKRLVREIVLSHAYRLASTYQEADFAADPENTLLWRASQRRLDAESIRDAMLSASGQLDLQPPIGSVIAEAGDGPIGGRGAIGVPEPAIVDSGMYRAVRSVYLPIARDVLPDALAVFDFSEPSLVSGNRESTNVPSQALYLLNSPFATQAAQKLAARLLAAYPGGPSAGIGANMDQRVTLAYWLACSRGPTAVERQAAATFFGKFPASWKNGDARVASVHDSDAVSAAWTSFCRALFACSDFRYLN